MYCINPNDDEPIFLLDCQIGQDPEHPEDKFIDGQQFARELMYMDKEKKKKMWIYINSPGGDVTQGEAIYGAMLLTETKVNTFCFGEAASIAGVIFQAGYKRIMLESARLMYHQAYIEGGAKSPEAKKSLEVTNDAIAKMISSRSWKDLDAVKRMMVQTTYINAEDAKASDLCDEVQNNADLNAPKNNDARAIREYGQRILNKVLPTIKKTSMEKVAKVLNLNTAASEEAVASEVSEILNKKKTAEEELEKEKAKNLALAKENEEMKAKAKADEEEKNKAKEATETEAKNKAAEAAKVTAKTKILEAAKNRGISLSDEQTETYLGLAGSEEAQLNAVIKTIDAIPMGKKMPIAPLNLGGAKDEKVFTVSGKDEFGMDKIIDTDKAVSEMNKQVLNRSKERFSGK